jgi:hypothetical protein
MGSKHVQIIDSADVSNNNVSEKDLHQILSKVDASCAQAIVEDFLDEATHKQEEHRRRDEDSKTALRRQRERLAKWGSAHSIDLDLPSPSALPEGAPFADPTDGGWVENESIPNHKFKELLGR